MHLVEFFQHGALPENWFWYNEPPYYGIGNGLEVTTRERSEFWQGTYYGFKQDDGHCLLTRIAEDFAITTHVIFQARNRHDQCGLMVRIDAENWIKVFTECHGEASNKLGSVVTNLGFSDWAVQDAPPTRDDMWYRIQSRGSDFLLEHSPDGKNWQQMRLAHLHKKTPHYAVGVYACSPADDNFQCTFKRVEITESLWKAPTP